MHAHTWSPTVLRRRKWYLDNPQERKGTKRIKEENYSTVVFFEVPFFILVATVMYWLSCVKVYTCKSRAFAVPREFSAVIYKVIYRITVMLTARSIRTNYSMMTTRRSRMTRVLHTGCTYVVTFNHTIISQ